jgi:hypothetical protein
MEEIISKWVELVNIFDINDVNHMKKDKHVEKLIDKLCWHCCHSIPRERVTLQYPYKLLSSGQFQVGGQFCSWECVKAHGRDHMSRVLSGVHQLNIRHYRKMITGLSDPVIPAPPKMTLKAFGGHLDIEEFRNPNANMAYVVNYAKLIKVAPYETHEYNFGDKHVSAKQSDKEIHIENTAVVNDSLKLRRPKPAVKGKSTLERSLGLNTFGNLIKTFT